MPLSTRYLEHLLDQAERIVARQDIRYLFTTPIVLDALTERLDERARAAIRFVYLGGMAIEDTVLLRCAARLPAARFLSGYGNTLFGVCHEARPVRPQAGPRAYYPQALLPVVRERDEATRLPPQRDTTADGFGDPRPPAAAKLHIDHGIY
jgi:acyl-coenzyme A synthetase/AMP-(fatty) acid ligase